jgi:hypothetical protein
MELSTAIRVEVGPIVFNAIFVVGAVVVVIA